MGANSDTNVKTVLFCAESVYQLFNVITLRMTVCNECACDLILSNLTDWEEDLLKRLQDEELFGQIVRPNTRETEHSFWDKDEEERIKVLNNPVSFFEGSESPIELKYDEMFVPIDHIYWKMLYYYQMLNHVNTKVIMYDEGVRTYIMDVRQTDDRTFFKNSNYASFVFSAAVEEYYVYQPSLYAVKEYKYELKQMPNPMEYSEVRDTLLRVYGQEELPKEPYIYLEDVFFTDRFVTNDFDLFEEIAEFVGKENIIVKRHPRDDYDRFSVLGYKTIERSVVPWEIQLLANDMFAKVLISVSSTAMLTPYLIFNSDMHVISLEKMCIGDTNVRLDAKYGQFFNSMIKKANENEVHVHTPSTMEELKDVLRYIKLVQYSKAKEGNVNE